MHHGNPLGWIELVWQTLAATSDNLLGSSTAWGQPILVYDVPAAQATAALLVRRERAGRPMTLADAQIAGTCVAQGASLTTSNVADFTGTPHLTLVNPFG